MGDIIQLFFSFIQVGLFSVGGGYAAIPLIQNQIVDTHSFMNMEQFTDLITIAEMTPGPISINSATFVGTQLAGLPGALICSLGCVLPSFFICLSLAYFYYKYRNLSGVQTILANLRPAVVALISSAGLSILALAVFSLDKNEVISLISTNNFTFLQNFRVVELLLFALGLFLLRKFKLNPIMIIFGSGVIGTITYYVIGLF